MLAWILDKLMQRARTLEAKQQRLDAPTLSHTDRWLKEGYQLQTAGELMQAEAAYRKVLYRQPQHADALYMLSGLKRQLGDRGQAIELARKAVAANENVGAFHAALAELHREAGDLPAAEASLREAIRLEPGNPEYLNDLGTLLHGQHRTEEALACYEKSLALKPDLPQALYNRGMLYREKSELQKAIASIEQALALQPDYSEGFISLGDIHLLDGDPARAMKCYQHGLAGQPEAEWPPQVKANLAEAHFIHANALLGETRPAEAITHYLQALDLNKETLAFWAPADHASRRADVPELDPVCARAINNIGIAIRDTMDCEQAREIMARVQRLLPGLSWQETDTDRFCELDIGLALLNCALDLEPTLADAYISKDVILEDRGRFSEAHACCERALELAPESAEARFNLGISLLRMGELAKGWQDYEARLKLGTHIRKEHLQAAPLWRGEALVDQVLLVHAEQGLGDTIQFIRYYPEVAARCKKVILECEAPVKSLITNISGVTNVYAAGEPLPKFDLQIPLLSLPGIFGTRLDNIPASIPYILPDAAKAHEWHSIVSRQKGLKAGLVWAGSKTHKGNRFRSCSLAVFAPLAEVTGVSFFSLQKGEAAGEAGSAPAGMTLLDYSKQLEDFVDTAALVSQLDLVITVDTSVAHLAGAMGKPVWVLVPFCPDWRWLLDREDSPWYPSMRLFRQTAIGDWGEGIERIKQELSRLSAGMGEHTL